MANAQNKRKLNGRRDNELATLADKNLKCTATTGFNVCISKYSHLRRAFVTG
jgi:hypothetical protein